MAGANGIDDSDLKRFSIFPAIRYLTLEGAGEGRKPLGHFHPPGQEAVRLSCSSKLSHPATEIESVERTGGEPAVLRTFGYGLFGGSGELPLAWSAYATEREQRGDRGFQAFLDILHHRLFSFLYRAWCSPRFPTAAEAGEPNPMDGFLRSLLGLPHTPAPEEVHAGIMSCAALLLPRPRSAEALKGMLAYYFDVPVEIEQFHGGWRKFGRHQYTRLEDEPAAPASYQQLGLGAALGDEAWDPQAAVRIRLGPMPRARYEEFLPDGPAYRALRALVDFFAHGGFDYEINPILQREDVPAIPLGEAVEPCSSQYEAAEVRLGWTTWLTSRPLERDADDTVLRAWQATAAEGQDEPARTGHEVGSGSPESHGGRRGAVCQPHPL